MGIKHLWTVLAPFCDRKPLYELQGKVVAIDLSCWICEAQNIAEYQVQPRMYLRNLYFRTCYLLLLDVTPVFVLEGKAPELKYDTISARNALQFKGAKPKTQNNNKVGKDRSRFNFVLKQCEEMLKFMGIACIKGSGEAESLCAYLNEDGLVDGCISQDSDCFAYGAQIVFRNFSISTQGVQAASGGSVDVYDIKKITESLHLGRNKIVVMALLVGSDYSDGVYGIGKDSVMKFFENVADEEVLDRIRSWRNNKDMYETYEKQLNDKNSCSSCGHNGKLQSHTRNGCVSCKTTKGCDSFKYKEERLIIKNEVAIRQKALQDPNFPNETLIKEFLHRKDNIKKLDLAWKQPNLIKFIKFTTHFLQWEELYAFEKFLPVLTRWQCRNSHLLHNNEDKLPKGLLEPEKIKKIRKPKGIPSYEIIWKDPHNEYENLIPQNQLTENQIDFEKLWSTIEPQTLVDVAYPKLVEVFTESKTKPKKAKKRVKHNNEVDNLAKEFGNVSISQPHHQPKKTRKTVPSTSLENKSKTFDNYFKTGLLSSCKSANNKNGGIGGVSTPIKSSGTDFNLDISCFGDEDDNLDVSDIVEDIISNRNGAEKLKKIAIEVIQIDDDNNNNSMDNGSFFNNNPGDPEDLFEMEFNETFKNFNNSESEISDEETEAKSPSSSSSAAGKRNFSINLNDTFSNIVEIPLAERIKLKI